MNNLQRRLDKLEERRNMKKIPRPFMLVKFIEAIHDKDGRPSPGPCVKMLKMQPGGGQQWMDAEGNHIEAPA